MVDKIFALYFDQDLTENEYFKSLGNGRQNFCSVFPS